MKKKSIYVIAEAGTNWKIGSYKHDLDEAKKMIRIAAKLGADAIKFQSFNPEKLYAQNAGHSKYLQKSGIYEDVNKMFRNLSMKPEMIPELFYECKKNSIDFLSSVFSVEDAKLVDPYVKFHKIASYEINHTRLLEYMNSIKKPLIISTGASTIKEIKYALSKLKNKKKIILLQCTSSYPCPVDELNLNAIVGLKKEFKLPIGLSDHSSDPVIAPITAIALGAKIIEKHFTLDKKRKGPDHKFSLNPEEFKIMIESIRNVEKSLGSEKKRVYKIENELRLFAKRKLHATKQIEIGDYFSEGVNFDILRSGIQKPGLNPRFIDKINGKKSKKRFKIGEGIV